MALPALIIPILKALGTAAASSAASYGLQRLASPEDQQITTPGQPPPMLQQEDPWAWFTQILAQSRKRRDS